MMCRPARLIRIIVAALFAFAPATVSADVSASAVKAAYLYKIAAFVSWPQSSFPSPSAPFRICVAGRDDILRPLAQLANGQRAWGRPVTVARIGPGSSVSQCQILFRGNASVAVTDSAPVLTVTDRGSDVADGVIEFFADGSHVRFVVHRTQADRRGLDLSSKLLAVAAAVSP
jgi:hypothetical protein